MYEHEQVKIKTHHINSRVFFFFLIMTKDDIPDKKLKPLKGNKSGYMSSNTSFSLQPMTILSLYQVFSKNISIACLMDKLFPLW